MDDYRFELDWHFLNAKQDIQKLSEDELRTRCPVSLTDYTREELLQCIMNKSLESYRPEA